MKDEKESWLLNLANKGESFLFYLTVLLIPTQFGKHFWPSFSLVVGQRIDYLSPTLYVSDITLIMLFFVSIFRKRISVHPFFSLLVLFLAGNIFFSQFSLNGWYEFFKFLEVSFLAWYVMKRGADLFIGIALALGVIVEVFLSLWQVLIQQSVGGFFYFLGERSFSTTTPGIANASLAGQLFLRPYGTFSHPNILAGYFLVVSFLLIFLSQKTRRNFMKGLLCVVAGLGFLGCILTLSRVAIVGLFIGVVVLIHKNLSSAVRTAAVILIAFGGILFFVSLFYPEVIIRFLPGSYGQSVSERVMLAQASLAMIKHVPLFGVGLGAFLPSLPYFSIDSLILQPVHNIYLLIASEAGMVGISVFIFFLWEVLQKTLRKQLLLVCLFSILFTGMFDHYWLTIQQGQLLFGFLIGACLHESHAGGTIQR